MVVCVHSLAERTCSQGLGIIWRREFALLTTPGSEHIRGPDVANWRLTDIEWWMDTKVMPEQCYFWRAGTLPFALWAVLVRLGSGLRS